MARYVKTLPTAKAPDVLGQEIRNYLEEKGFVETDDDEKKWRKGKGFLLHPQFVRFETRPNELHLEAWIEFAMFAGIRLGEFGIDGLLFIIPKRMLKARVVDIERLALS